MDVRCLRTHQPTPSPTSLNDENILEWHENPFGIVIFCVIFGIPICLACCKICFGRRRNI